MDFPLNDEDDSLGFTTATPQGPPQPEMSSTLDDAEERGTVVAARGTADGLVLRIDGRVERQDMRARVGEFIASRRSFLAGNDVILEWVGRKPEEDVVREISALLRDDFSISVRSSKLKSPGSKTSEKSPVRASPEAVTAPPPRSPLASSLGVVKTSRGEQLEPARSMSSKMSLFDGMEGLDSRVSNVGAMLWDEPDARIVYGTLRSGQKVESEHSIVIVGDVNSGGEVIAGGDIIVLGTLRGVAHAGAYDETGGGRVIFSLALQPTQLRIGMVISRGAGVDGSSRAGAAELARVENGVIVVEAYQARNVWGRRRES